MSYERLSQLHTNSACGGSVGLFSARRLGFPGHVPGYSTPLRSALSLAVRRSMAELVICRGSSSYVAGFAAACGSGRFLRVTTGSQRRAFCLSTHLRSRLSPGLRFAFDVQTRSASRLDVPAIAAVRGSRRFLRARNSSLRRAGSSATRFSAPCFCGGAFSGSTRSLPRNSKAEVTANNWQQLTGAALSARRARSSLGAPLSDPPWPPAPVAEPESLGVCGVL